MLFKRRGSRHRFTLVRKVFVELQYTTTRSGLRSAVPGSCPHLESLYYLCALCVFISNFGMVCGFAASRAESLWLSVNPRQFGGYAAEAKPLLIPGDDRKA